MTEDEASRAKAMKVVEAILSVTSSLPKPPISPNALCAELRVQTALRFFLVSLDKQEAENVTTWAEDAVNVRSDCHAWGSVPISDFITEVAGIKPTAPGWSRLYHPNITLTSSD
ncbi:glycoside hydrolase family 78 protein [Cadophora sp. DSE1049]|nr:glycoside hydrolase family 78 protein [Cadophora sp. DSE1049]